MAQSNPNVMFKRGAQSALNELTSYVDGAFYLTTDTDRLYVAQSTSKLVELNKSITTVDEVADLPSSNVADGQFYYAVKENILCIYKETGVTGAPKWVQINPDTVDGNDHVSGFSITKKEINASGDLVYDWELTQSDKNGSDISTLKKTGTFTIAKADIAQLGGIAVDVDAANGATGSNSAIVSLGGFGADTTATAGKVTIKGGDNVQVSASDNTITVVATDTTYGLSSAANAATIDLATGNNSSAGSVEIKGDGGYISVDGSTAGEIKVQHGNSGATAGTYGESGKTVAHRSTTDTVVDGMKITVPKITVDAKGHVTSASSETFTLPADNDTTYTAVAATVDTTTAGETGKITVGINNGTSDITATSGRILYNTITVDGTAKTVYNTEDLGTFYSASKVDEKLNAVDAMTYKGTLGGTGSTVSSLPTSGVKIGDTYKVAADGTYASTTAYVGDLFIATGTETSGVITSGLAWTYVPSGADADTTYAFSAADNQLILSNDVNGSQQVVEIDGGTALTAATTTVKDAQDKTTGYKITLNHDVSGATAGTYGNSATAPVHGGTITIPKVTVDAQGHVTGISDVSVTLPADNDTTYSFVGNNANKSIVLKDSKEVEKGSLTFDQGNAITVTMTGDDADDKTVTVAHSNITRTDSTPAADAAATSKNFGDTFTVVTGVTSNDQGHITGVTSTKFSMPSEKATDCTATAADNKLAIEYNNAVKGSIQLQSDNLEITSDATSAASGNLVTTINMVWGTF